MGVTGEVMALQGDKAELAISRQAPARATGRAGRRSAAASALRPARPAVRSARPRAAASRSATKHVPAELNLIGLTVEEARERVDKLLDDAALSDRRELRLVHGFGEGKLRKAVAELLEGHPLVVVLAARRAERGRRRSDGRGAQGLAMAFPDSFVEEVRRAADIVRVISEHVALKKTGHARGRACARSTRRRRPSFNVRQEPAVFHCFGCGEGGDVFKFVMLRERMSFPEAVEMLARRFGVPVPEGRVEPGPDRKEREELLALMEAAAQHFTRTLWTAPGTKAREYLLGRGFQKETLEKIRAGAARDAWDDLLGALRGKFAPALLLKAGPRARAAGQGRPLRPLPQPRRLPDPERVRARWWPSARAASTAASPST